MNFSIPILPCVRPVHTLSAILTVLLTVRHKKAHLMSNMRSETTALHELRFSLCKVTCNKALGT